MALERTPRRPAPRRTPRALPDRGLFEVDGSWGTIQPMELAPGVRTVGELEVIAHIEAGGPLVDTRLAEFYERATIPGAVSIPHTEVLERMGELDRHAPAVFFCNGPQCSATPDAARTLLGAGFPPEAILYYRGGIHDWMTLGLPVVPGGRTQRETPDPEFGSARMPDGPPAPMLVPPTAKGSQP